MNPLTLFETSPGEYRLTLVAGTTDVDDVVVELGHEPNGDFWYGIVELLVATEAPALEGRYEPDPEGGAYLANSTDRAALEALGALLLGVATDENRLRQLVERAETTGFVFG